MKKTMYRLLLLLFMAVSTAVYSGVDVTLRFHYNNYPLCNWEVELKHNDAPVGTGITDSLGIVVFTNVFLPSKEVSAYLYRLPKSGDGRWNAQGFIRLEEDYTGELDFGPIVATKDAPKSRLEEAWGITLYDCSDFKANVSSPTPPAPPPIDDPLPSPSTPPTPVQDEALNNELVETEYITIALDAMTQNNYKRRIDSLKEQHGIVNQTLKDLNKSGPPQDEWGLKIYNAMLEELERQKELIQKQLTITKYRAKGKELGGMLHEEKALQNRYDSARATRENLQHQARKAVVEDSDETGGAHPFERRLNKLQTDLALKKQALKNEEESLTPDAKRIAQLRGDIERLRRKISDLVE